MCINYVYIFRIMFSFLLKFFSFSPPEIPYISSWVLLYVFRFNFCVNNGLEKQKKANPVSTNIVGTYLYKGGLSF